MESLKRWIRTGTIGALLTGCMEGPEMLPGIVTIKPETPSANRDLRCYVENYKDVSFDFFWFVKGELLYSNTGTRSRLEKGYTRSGDNIWCEAWDPATGEFDASYHGSDDTYIG